MKHGILIYQVPAMTDRTIFAEDYDFTDFSFLGIGKGKRYLDTLKAELVKLDYPVSVVKDDTRADLEEIISRQYDFVICTPGLQKKIILKDKLPQIFFIDSLDYHNSLISKIISNIKNDVL
ncbi:MAG: hypothetical protein KC455_08200 [Carnobacterium sp.]|nr:hypothetical protein [Carnobacterium sp.]